jgi:putative selenate reductase
MSVGYDLAGIRSERVQAFVGGMRDARVVVDRLRRQIPDELRALRDIDFPTALSDSVTLSTFHGCPPDEIERILDFLLGSGLNCIVKLNPMLLGPERARELLNEVMGYAELRIPDTAFERDTRWEQMLAFVERLGRTAVERGLGFGVKFSNTLIVENHRSFFPASEKEMYLSGPPLYVLAMNLVREFRRAFGMRFPVSYSAGIDRANFPDAVALGLVPVTVCSDLLKPRGYARATGYLEALGARMRTLGARSVPDYVIRAYGLGAPALRNLGVSDARRLRACESALAGGSDLAVAAGPELHARWVAEAARLNTEHHVARATEDPRYAQAAHRKPPRKIGSQLELFDCVSCHKCVPVCPNDANFDFALPRLEQQIVKLRHERDAWTSRTEGRLVIEQARQYASFADFCNECGNCDVFCPEDGGPYVVKPRFFGRLDDWRASALDGFVLEAPSRALLGRIGGIEYRLATEGDRARYEGPGFSLLFDPADPLGSLTGRADGELDLSYFHILRWIRDAVYAGERVNYLNALAD